MFVTSENGNLTDGHDGQLEWRRDADDGAERNQNRGRREISVQQTEFLKREKTKTNDVIHFTLSSAYICILYLVMVM